MVIFARELSLSDLRLGCFARELLLLILSLRNFRLITSAQDPSPDNLHSGYFAGKFRSIIYTLVLRLGIFIWDIWFGFFGLGSLAWDLWRWVFGLGSLLWNRWLGIFNFGSLAWDLRLRIFGLESLALDLWLGHLALDLWLGIVALGSLVWDLGLREQG